MSSTPKKTQYNSKLQFISLVSRISVLIESLSTFLFPILIWCMLFAVLYISLIPFLLGSGGIILTSFLFWGGLGYLIYRQSPVLSILPRERLFRRIEKESNVYHRPVQTLNDTPVSTSLSANTSNSLWEKGIDAAKENIMRLRPIKPAPLFARKDPYSLRFVLVILLGLMIFIAQDSWKNRIANGLFPLEPLNVTAAPDFVSVWIKPPEYTKLKTLQIQLDDENDRKTIYEIPQNSTLEVRVSKGRSKPRIYADQKTFDFQAMGETNHSWSQSIDFDESFSPEGEIVIKQTPKSLGSFSYKLKPDTPPIITMEKPPEKINKGDFKAFLNVKDDYSVKLLLTTIELDPIIEEPPFVQPFEQDRMVYSVPDTETKLQPIYNLAWHPWSGLPVHINFKAIDDKGQETSIESVPFILPERTFENPVSKELVRIRKLLIWDQEKAQKNAASDLLALLVNPKVYKYDITTTLGIRSAAVRLYNHTDRDNLISVIELLWDIAIHIEDGNRPAAYRTLQEAQDALSDMLENPDATDEQIADAMEALRQAMADYLYEVYKDRQSKYGDMSPEMQTMMEMLQQNINPEALERLLDQMRSQALSGERQSAQEMLSQLQRFMENFSSSQSLEMPEDMQFMAKAMSGLQELIEQQEILLDQTKNIKGLQSSKQKQVEQDALRYALGQLMLESDAKLGEIPQPMQDAEQEMRLSANALGQDDPRRAVPHQEKALEHLKDSLDDMSEKLQQALSQMPMLSFGQGGMGPRDPLGRPFGNNSDVPGFANESDIQIPDEFERRRIQDILDTLRKKSGEFDRPEYELDYFRRLLKRF